MEDIHPKVGSIIWAKPNIDWVKVKHNWDFEHPLQEVDLMTNELDQHIVSQQRFLLSDPIHLKGARAVEDEQQ